MTETLAASSEVLALIQILDVFPQKTVVLESALRHFLSVPDSFLEETRKGSSSDEVKKRVRQVLEGYNRDLPGKAWKEFVDAYFEAMLADDINFRVARTILAGKMKTVGVFPSYWEAYETYVG